MSYLCKITTSRARTASQITFSSSVVFLSHLKTRENVGVGVGSLFNSCSCSTSHAPAAIWFACFQFLCSMSHFKVRENEIVGGGIGSNSISSALPFSFPTSNILCKLQHLGHLRQVKLHFLPLSFAFSHLRTREKVGAGCW